MQEERTDWLTFVARYRDGSLDRFVVDPFVLLRGSYIPGNDARRRQEAGSLKLDYAFEDGSEIDFKGKGLMHYWFLVNRKEEAGQIIEPHEARSPRMTVIGTWRTCQRAS